MEQKQVGMQTWVHRWEGNESTVKNTGRYDRNETAQKNKQKKVIAGVS